MNGWRENDFLEKLLPSLRAKHGVNQPACPDAATLSAAAEGDANAWLKEAVAGHLENCSECAALCERLLQFGVGTLPDLAADWQNTEKRLDNWLEGFLRSREAESLPHRHYAEKKSVKMPKSSFWMRPWALGFTTALVLLAAGVYFVEFGPVTYRQLALKTAQVEVTKTASSSAARSPNPAEKPQIEKAVAEPAKAAAISVSNKPLSSSPKKSEKESSARSEVAERTTADPDDVAVASQSPSSEVGSKPADDSTPLEAENAPNPDATTASPSSAVSNVRTASHAPDAGLETRSLPRGAGAATRPSHPPSIRDADIASVTPRQPTAPMRGPVSNSSSSFTHGGSIPKPQAITPAATSVVLGSSFRLTAGTRIWVVINPTNDGRKPNFVFQGTLLLPVTQNDVQVLARDTAVYGSGTVSGAHIFLTLDGFVVQGRQYRVKNTAGFVGPGAGKALSYESGKVMEMWLSADSSYESTGSYGGSHAERSVAAPRPSYQGQRSTPAAPPPAQSGTTPAPK